MGEGTVMAESRGIWIISEDPSPDSSTGGKGSGPSWGAPQGSSQPSRVSAATLKANMDEFLSILEEALEQAERSQGRIRLDEVELAVEISGEGQIRLLGNGGKAGGKGSIKLKFKRVQ